MISISILCGGRSKRFGADKTFHVIGEKTILEMVVDKFENRSDDIFLQTSNNNMNNNKIQEFNVALYRDLIPEKGPLGGIYSALEHAKYDKAFVIAGDLPFVDVNILSELSKFKEFQIVVPRWPNGFLEPLCALYSKDLIPIIKDQIENGELKINRLFEKVEENSDNLKIKYVDIDEFINNGRINSKCFKNINCLDDLEES